MRRHLRVIIRHVIYCIIPLTCIVFNVPHFIKNFFSVKTLAAQWSEWIISVPLMMYITVSMADDEAVQRNGILEWDSTLPVSMFFCILFGAFCTVIKKPEIYWTSIFLSCICELSAHFSLVRARDLLRRVVHKVSLTPMNQLVNGVQKYKLLQVSNYTIKC